MEKRVVLFLLAVGWEQLIPRAVKPLFEAHKSCDQDIDLSGLNFLKRTDMQIRLFSKFLLSDFTGDARAPQISAKFLNLNFYSNRIFHYNKLYEKVS